MDIVNTLILIFTMWTPQYMFYERSHNDNVCA